MTNSLRATRAFLTAAALLAPMSGATLVHAQEPEAAAGDVNSAPAADAAVAPLPVVDIDRTQRRVLTLDLVRPPNDIWDRIRRGFGMPDVPGTRADKFQRSYLAHPEYLDRMFNRGARYLYYIVGELERRGMPTEIALLPMVESSFNPTAHSRARASGLWQFIPSTGRNYNLRQNRWVDERRDVIASTNAALDYLADIYERHGDWHLTLASYNRGENGIARAVERNRAAGRSTEFNALNLPRETRDYLPKLQALKNIVAMPEVYGIELPYVANRQLLATIAAPIGIDLATAARYAQMPLDEFLAFNPGYNLPAITADGQTLVIPSDRADEFARHLDEFRQSGNGWRIHHLARGETLNAVAERHGLNLSDLLLLNVLPAQSRPPVDYPLLVPGPGVLLADALAVCELLPASARLMARTGVRVAPKNKTAKRSGKSKTPAAKKKPRPRR
ncbi:MAG: transglycosylase SLT domain-containing protein [Azoarcus sp.]|jgi:membrane-bound lytic murein transglycosylase D|nr:transglycosylase SLT domain-containing protein [Azoarcus sp.]